MRKTSRKTLRNKLDKICSEIVRKRGKCEKCGKKENLQTAHIFGRTYNNTRWDLDNLLCLCPDCHINFAHKQPILFAEWVKAYVENDRYEMLKECHRQITKFTKEDLAIKFQVLETILKYGEAKRFVNKV